MTWLVIKVAVLFVAFLAGRLSAGVRHHAPLPPPIFSRQYVSTIRSCIQQATSDFAEFRTQQGALPRGELRLEIQVSSASSIASTLAGLGWCVGGQPLGASWDGYLESATINIPVEGAILDHLKMARPVQDLIACGACGVVTLSFGVPASPGLAQARLDRLDVRDRT